MKIKVNKNFVWSDVFINRLVKLGVKYACISPGSRSAPLSYSLASNKNIKSFVHIDERSSGFFALGIAKVTGIPVIVVTTSGTATAELYPAIIEAYQQRTPLIICTADRPAELVDTGANQTINQRNIYKNHIRWFRDVGLPSTKEYSLKYLQKIATKAFEISSLKDKGPVHLNFPFEKPLEPFSFTDEINEKLIKINSAATIKNDSLSKEKKQARKKLENLSEKLIDIEKGLIIAGPLEYDRKLTGKIKQLSIITGYPVLADASSQLRFALKKSDKNVISNYHSILLSEKFVENHQPDIIIQLGRTVTSSSLENYLAECECERYSVNNYGDLFDPSRKTKTVYSLEPCFFSEVILNFLSDKKFKRNKSSWLKDFNKAEEISEKMKQKIFIKSKLTDEPGIINETLNCIPEKTNILIGNSLPIRDFDNFATKTTKEFIIHFNRGASGIDGVTSTALGISSTGKKTVLLTGDLSFLHDIGSLASAVKYSLPVTVILINNNGGRIFGTLPISRKKKLLSRYFVTPHNLELDEIIKSFGVDYFRVNDKYKFVHTLKNCIKQNSTSVIEIKTNADASVKLRNNYFNEVKKIIDREF